MHGRRATVTRPAETTATVIPAIRYRDAPAAIDWLCDAFGFERHMVVEGEDGAVAHAQLPFGNGMVMLGTHRDDGNGALVGPPQGLCSQGRTGRSSGREGGCPYV